MNESFQLKSELANPKPKRVRRVAMNVETFARFCNASSLALGETIADFDPSPIEVERMLHVVMDAITLMVTTTKRRTQ